MQFKKFYAGIGSRKTPTDVQQSMQQIAYQLGKKGYRLRSGGAIGADTAFMAGTIVANFPKTVYLPSFQFNGYQHNPLEGFLDSTTVSTWQEALDMVDKYHPAPDKLSSFARKLMARNAYQVLSTTLKDPVDFVICWTKDGKLVGGTAQAMKIAMDFGIPIYNLAIVEDIRKLHKEVLC